jgi:hypothetical protein
LPYWQRHQIPLQGGPDVTFHCGEGDDEEEMWLEPGNAYWFNARKRHAVKNRSNQNRLAMVLEFVLLLGIIFGGTVPCVAQGITPQRAWAFQDTIGVNTHMGSGDSFYTGNPTQIITDLQYYGATKIRDNFSTGGTALTAWTLAANAGIKLLLVAPGGTLNAVSNLISQLHTIANAIGGPQNIKWVEGPNEPDNNNWMPTYNGLTNWQGVANFMKDYYTAIKADSTLNVINVASPTDIFAESPNVGLQWPTVPAGGAGTTAAGGTTFYQTYNFHQYPLWEDGAVGMIDPNPAVWNAAGGGNDVINQALADHFVTTGFSNKRSPAGGSYAGASLATVQASPIIYTEWGWQRQSEILDPTKRAIAHTNAYLVGFQKGLDAMFVYQLYDSDGNLGEGVFNSAGVTTPTAVAVHNVTTILHDPAANAASFTPTPINVTVTGLPGDGQWFLLQKASGNYQVVLWRNTTNYNTNTNTANTITPVNVTVSLPSGTLGNFNSYNVISGTNPIATAAAKGSATISLADSASIVDIAVTVLPNARRRPIIQPYTPAQPRR